MIIKSILLASREGHYTNYVFKNLDTNELIMCTRLPDWDCPIVSVGDVGFLQYKTVSAGEEYYNPSTETVNVYKYTNVYFENFVLENKKITNTNNNIIL